jgi:hypothetical protein
MKKSAIACVLALGAASGCTSRTPHAEQQQPTLNYTQVQNPAREMCRDDTLSPTELFNVPLAVFDAGTVQLNGRAASERELSEWADEYYKARAERALWVQISPESAALAERALIPIVRVYPDLQLRRVQFGFTCPKVAKQE